MTFKKLTIVFCIFFILQSSQAQQYLGIVGSNYNGTNGLFTNPSNKVDSRHKIFINLAAADLFLGNNAVKWNADYSFGRLLRGGINPSLPKVVWRPSNLETIENNKEKNLNGLVDLKGPAILYSIDNNQTVALISRGRGGLSLNNLSPELAILIQKGSKNPTIIRNGTNQSITTNMNAFTEIGLNYARNISPYPEEAINVGISVKRIIGLTNLHFIAKNSDFQIIDNVPDPLGGAFLYDDVLDILRFNGTYGNSNEQTGINDFNFSPGYWLGKPSPGHGIGVDLGISYEYRPNIRKYAYREKGVEKFDETKNKYEYKLGISLIDIGSVKFDNNAYVQNYTATVTNRRLFENLYPLLPNVTGNELITTTNDVLGVSATSSIGSFRSKLPLNFQTYVDYKLQENVYVYATWVQNLRKSDNLGMRMPSLVSIVPRYETPSLEFAVPVSLLNDYQLLTIGLSARLGPFFIGSDNLQGLLSIGKPKGFDFFTGLNIPIHYKLPKLPNNCYYDTPKGGLKKWFKRKKR
jgi:hypothetical protein